MYTLLLVDDEPRQVKAMTSIIKQLKPSYDILQAHEGESALQLLQNQHVDIVISDIRMPGMDGLELMQHVSKLKRSPKLIMLTGYDDFQYAVQAIRNRAYDYLLKPIGKPELIELLNRVETTLNEERAEDQKLASIQNKLSDMTPVFETHLFTCWLDGKASQVELEQIHSSFLDWAHSGILIVIEPGKQVSSKGMTTSNPAPSLDFLRNKLQEHLYSLGKPLTVQAEHNRIITILPLFTNITGLSLQLESRLENMTADFHAETGMGITVGISPGMDHLLVQVPVSYSQVLTAMKHKFYKGLCSVIHSHKMPPFQNQYPFKEDFGIIEQYMHKQDSFHLNRAIQDHIDKLKQNRCDPDLVRDEWGLFMTTLFHNMVHMPNHPEQMSWLTEARSRLTQVPDSYALKKLVSSFLLRLMEQEEKQSKNQHQLVIDQCIHYLKTNYQKDLSLEDTAQRFHFHPSYFSTLFKNVTGTGFSEYIQKIRISKAKDLIMITDDKMSDIALQVGYKDAAYFTKIFKKETGISPNKYKRFHTMDQQRGSGFS